jgi:hypothetical protein
MCEGSKGREEEEGVLRLVQPCFIANISSARLGSLYDATFRAQTKSLKAVPTTRTLDFSS